jgi:hypothetical protein
MQAVAEDESLGWKSYGRFMNSPEVLGIGKSLEAMLSEARKQGLESENALTGFLRSVHVFGTGEGGSTSEVGKSTVF